MSRHARLIVTVLIALIALLVAAIVLFYLDVNKDSGDSNESGSASLGGGSVAFVSEDGLCGLEDSAGNIILEAEWQSLVPVGNGYYKAILETREKTLSGVIDSEGDIAVPFVYEDIERLTELVYTGVLAEGGVHIYSADFRQLMPEAWDSCTVKNERMHLIKGEDEYTFVIGEKLILWDVYLPRTNRPIRFNLNLSGEELESAECLEWSDIADKILCYLDALRREKPENIEDIAEPKNLNALREGMKTEFIWKGGLSGDFEVYNPENNESGVIYLKAELFAFDQSGKSMYVPLTLAFRRGENGSWLLSETVFDTEPAAISD